METSEKKTDELCKRVVTTNDDDATQALAELKAALRERIGQIKARASEVVPLISVKQKLKKLA